MPWPPSGRKRAFRAAANFMAKPQLHAGTPGFSAFIGRKKRHDLVFRPWRNAHPLFQRPPRASIRAAALASGGCRTGHCSPVVRLQHHSAATLAHSGLHSWDGSRHAHSAISAGPIARHARGGHIAGTNRPADRHARHAARCGCTGLPACTGRAVSRSGHTLCHAWPGC